MTCPYADPKCQPDASRDARRCQCARYVKRCGDCSARNRAFARFCRACGNALPASSANWPGHKGGPRRLGLHAAPVGSRYVLQDPKTCLQLQLGDACVSLLGYDGHLIATSKMGVIEVVDPARKKSLCRFQAQGPVTAEPCIDDGVLYVATRGQLTAYALAAMALETPRVTQLWQIPLNGPPLHALTVAGDRLFVTIASSGLQELHVVEGIHKEPRSARKILAARAVGWVAADPRTAEAAVLTEMDNYGVQLHLLGAQTMTHRVELTQLANHAVAFLDGTIFAVFGEARRLYRILANTGSVVEPLESDTQHFALSRAGEDDWDRDGIHIDTLGVTFLRSGVRDVFATLDRTSKGSPVIVQDSIALVGMEDGQVRIYNLAQAPRSESWGIGGSNRAPITALSAFDSYIAAGNSDGLVEVRELTKGGA